MGDHSCVKRYVSANELYENSFRLAKQIYDKEFYPDSLIALWRGGTPVGICVNEFFRYQKKDIPSHKAVRTESYRGIDGHGEVRIEHFEEFLENINKEGKLFHYLLLVDDVFDTGRTIEGIIKKVNEEVKVPLTVKIAVIYYKEDRNLTKLEPDFYIETVPKDTWLVFPHELEGLSKEDIWEKDRNLYNILFGKRTISDYIKHIFS